MKINTYRSVSLSFLTPPDLMSTWQNPVMKVGWQHCPESVIPEMAPSLHTHLWLHWYQHVSAWESVWHCLGALAGWVSILFYIKPQWWLGIRQNIWVLVPKAWERPSTERKERGWWLLRGIYSLGRVQSCPDIRLEGVNFLVLVPLCLDLRENPDVCFSLVFVAVTWQDTCPALLEWPLPLGRQLAEVPGFAEGYLTKISPFQCFSFLSPSHYNAAVFLRVWGTSNCSCWGIPTVSWMPQPPWWIRHMEYKRLHFRALEWDTGNPATRVGRETTKQTALQCTV